MANLLMFYIASKYHPGLITPDERRLKMPGGLYSITIVNSN